MEQDAGDQVAVDEGQSRRNPYLAELDRVRPVSEIESWAGYLQSYPERPSGESLKSVATRIGEMYALADFYQPHSVGFSLGQQTHYALREGLRRRSIPARPADFWKETAEARTATPHYSSVGPATSSLGITVVGPSGVGKTMTVLQILRSFPQWTEFKLGAVGDIERRHIVWLHVDCSSTGSPTGFLTNIVAAIDALLSESYMQKRVRATSKVDDLLNLVEELFARHRVGILAIDEIQALQRQGVDRFLILSLLTALENRCKVPIIYMGTYKAIEVLGKEMFESRRSTSMGEFLMHPLIYDEEWDKIVAALMAYQYTRATAPFSMAISRALHDASAGVLDIAVKVFLWAEARAMYGAGPSRKADEPITPELIKQVADDHLRLVQPFLENLRHLDRTDIDSLPRYEGRVMLDFGAGLQFEADQPPAGPVVVPPSGGTHSSGTNSSDARPKPTRTDPLLELARAAREKGQTIAKAIGESEFVMDPLWLLDCDRLREIKE